MVRNMILLVHDRCMCPRTHPEGPVTHQNVSRVLGNALEIFFTIVTLKTIVHCLPSPLSKCSSVPAHSPTRRNPTTWTLCTTSANLPAATTRLLVGPAARPRCRKEKEAWPGLPAAHPSISSGSWPPSWRASAWYPPWPQPQGSAALPGTPIMFIVFFFFG